MSTDTADFQSVDPYDPIQLKKFLTEAPAWYKSQLHRDERRILENCYRALWGNDLDMMQTYFFKEGLSDPSGLEALLEKHNLFLRNDESSMIMQTNQDNGIVKSTDDEPEYWESQRGKQCGHLFKRGESVYRCRNCGLDDTCVLCSRCFHATNHEGHDVKIWISRGSGGCCDCGDPEAWKTPMVCKTHSLLAASESPTSGRIILQPSSTIPQHLLKQIKGTIEIIVDYILETLAASPEDIRPGTEEEIKQDYRDSELALGTPSDNGEQPSYSCILWNDEKHSFDQVISIVTEATKCTVDQAAKMAEHVDTYGRQIVETSTNLPRLITMARKINSIRLAVTVRSSKDTAREDICGLLLEWLKELVSGRYMFFNNIQGGNCIIRDIICDVLCSEWSLRPELAALSMRKRRHNEPQHNAEFPDDLEESDSVAEMINNEIDMIAGPMQMLAAEGGFNAATDDEWMTAELNEPDDHDDYDDEDTNLDDGGDDDENDTDGYTESGNDMQFDSDVEMPYHPPTADSEQTSEHEPLLGRPATSTTQPQKPSKDIIDINWGLDSWLEYTNKLEADEHDVAQQIGIPILSANTSSENSQRIKKEFNRKLRLDYLIQYGLRLWKSARTNIKNLLIGTVISNLTYKPIAGIRFARNYPDLVDAFFFRDREPEHSITTLSVQLLTVPSVASTLVQEYRFFGLVCSIFANFFHADQVYLLPLPEYQHMQVDCASRPITRNRYALAIFDLRYVLKSDSVRAAICRDPIYLRHVLDMMYQFQAMDPLVRRADVHVEFESSTWITAFNVTLQISRFFRLFTDAFAVEHRYIDAQDASRGLCRSVYRTLQTMAEWSPRPPHANDALREPLQIVKGIKEQKYEIIHAPHVGPMQIVAYDVASSPVSFHHPYHWLLSGLLEHVGLLSDELLESLGFANGLKSLIDHFNSTMGLENAFLSLLEYPLRAKVLLAQIGCGVWVRNGLDIRNQARTYIDIHVRENTYDRDIYLLQVGFATVDPEQLLLTVLARFNVLDWFNGKLNKKHAHYDSRQLTTIVEECLDFLIICLTERSHALNLSTEAKIRREIIQYLGLSSMAYSELVTVIPESLSEHESFETLLNELAVYKAPNGLNDHGRYELKPEYYAELDPYYWHFTRNQREEAFEVIRKRQQGSQSSKVKGSKEEFFFIPKLPPIERGPFKSIGDALQSRMMCQIIVYGMWNCKTKTKAKSDSILEDALYLAILAVIDADHSIKENQRAIHKGKYRQGLSPHGHNGDIIQHAVEDKYSVIVNDLERKSMTLLMILLRYLADREYHHVHKRCQFIVDKIEEHGSENAKKTIHDWRVEHEQDHGNSTNETANDAVSEYERKKSAAKARQADIMAQFAKAQSQFLDQYRDEYDDEDELDDIQDADTPWIQSDLNTEQADVERMCYFPSGTCIVCQEELDKSRMYGMLALVQHSKILRETPLGNDDVCLDVIDTARGHDTWGTHMDTSQDKSRAFRGYPVSAHREGHHLSSCGHLMHAECFENFRTSAENNQFTRFQTATTPTGAGRKRFLCPLCKGLGNTLLPIVWKGKKEFYPGPLVATSSYEQLLDSVKHTMGALESEIQLSEPISEAEAIDDDILHDPSIQGIDIEMARHLYTTLSDSLSNISDSQSQLDVRKTMVKLYDMYWYVMSTMDVAQRGEHGVRARDLSAERTGTFLDNIAVQNLTLLKILTMTTHLIPRLLNSTWFTDENCIVERLAVDSLRQVFPYKYTMTPIENSDSAVKLSPLLLSEPSRALTRLAFVTQNHTQLSLCYLMRLLYLAELVKTALGLIEGLSDDKHSTLDHDSVKEALSTLESNSQHSISMQEGEAAKTFAIQVATMAGIPTTTTRHFFQRISPQAFASLMRTFSVSYLRRALFLMVVQRGYIPQNPAESDLGDNEYDTLAHILRLPLLVDMFHVQPWEQEIIGGWCQHKAATRAKAKLSLEFPGSYYPVKLPHRMDELFDESSRRICLKCNSQPGSPALCLICGTFVCARRYCCSVESHGECNLHMKTCTGEIGMYLVVKEGFVLLLHDTGGTIMNAPYLDAHGEADLFLKRGTPQYLNAQRYEQLRQMWLTHAVPAFVRRKMEASYSYTRWESW